jgi:hypothetical protein
MEWVALLVLGSLWAAIWSALRIGRIPTPKDPESALNQARPGAGDQGLARVDEAIGRRDITKLVAWARTSADASTATKAFLGLRKVARGKENERLWSMVCREWLESGEAYRRALALEAIADQRKILGTLDENVRDVVRSWLPDAVPPAAALYAVEVFRLRPDDRSRGALRRMAQWSAVDVRLAAARALSEHGTLEDLRHLAERVGAARGNERTELEALLGEMRSRLGAVAGSLTSSAATGGELSALPETRGAISSRSERD